MKEIAIQKYIRLVFGLAFLIYMLNKFYLRPWVLEQELPAFFQVLVFSLPNLIEAILGTLILSGILLQARPYLKVLQNTSDSIVYLCATVVAAVYVISQELRFHDLGGNNVYDPYDLAASFIGLLLTWAMLVTFGFSHSPNSNDQHSS